MVSRLSTRVVNMTGELGLKPMPLTCPSVLALDETGILTATVHNPSSDPATYDGSFSAVKESGYMGLPGCDFSLTVAPSKTETATCDMQPGRTPDYVSGVISIHASASTGSDLDTRLESSYEATCIIQVTRNPGLSGKQTLALTLIPILVLLLLGAAFWIAGAWPLSRQNILYGIMMLLVVLGWIGVVYRYLGR